MLDQKLKTIMELLKIELEENQDRKAYEEDRYIYSIYFAQEPCINKFNVGLHVSPGVFINLYPELKAVVADNDGITGDDLRVQAYWGDIQVKTIMYQEDLVKLLNENEIECEPRWDLLCMWHAFCWKAGTK